MHLGEEAEEDTRSYGRAYDASNVRSHRVHHQVVRPVILDALNLRYASRVRNGRDSRIADQRIDLVALLEEEVHHLDKEYSRAGRNDEGKCTEHKDLYRVEREEVCRLCRGSHCHTEKDRDNVDEWLTSRTS